MRKLDSMVENSEEKTPTESVNDEEEKKKLMEDD